MALKRKLALELMAMLADQFGPTSKIAQEMPRWLKMWVEVEPPRLKSQQIAIWWTQVRNLIATEAERVGSEGDEVFTTNIDRLAEHLGLSDIETRIFRFMTFIQIFDGFKDVANVSVSTGEVSYSFLIARYSGAAEAEVRALLRPGAALRNLGILTNASDRRMGMEVKVSERLCKAMLADIESVDQLIALLFPPATLPEADWQDFTGLGALASLMRDILARAMASGLPGVNILLYGPSGTGKTEFCKVLAQELKAELRAIGEGDEIGRDPSDGERLSELRLASRLFARRCDTILLFDEMEDLLGGHDDLNFFLSRRSRYSGSKVHFNRMLETNPIPVLWTTNSIDDCDPAFLRRMTYSLEMRPPTGEIRTRIWQRLDQRIGPGIDAKTLREMAEENPLPPALVADAMRVARLCDGGAEVFGQVLEASARVTNGGVAPARQARPDRPWQPELAQADCDLMRVEALVSKPDAPRRLSFCLEGPPGTGKSAWARHLAKVMGLPVIEKRASDLLSMWLGGSEKNIARAFASARAEGAMLIFDEADSLLSDRRSAQQSWEVTQVNEMLTWMESHPLPFVCTTNFVERLDPATQRRFTFRIRFGWLTPAQLPLAWTVHFGTPAPRELVALDRLTPGDFANVARRIQALGETDPSTILAQLQREIEAKESTPRPIGFGR